MAEYLRSFPCTFFRYLWNEKPQQSSTQRNTLSESVSAHSLLSPSVLGMQGTEHNDVIDQETCPMKRSKQGTLHLGKHLTQDSKNVSLEFDDGCFSSKKEGEMSEFIWMTSNTYRHLSGCSWNQAIPESIVAPHSVKKKWHLPSRKRKYSMETAEHSQEKCTLDNGCSAPTAEITYHHVAVAQDILQKKIAERRNARARKKPARSLDAQPKTRNDTTRGISDFRLRRRDLCAQSRDLDVSVGGSMDTAALVHRSDPPDDIYHKELQTNLLGVTTNNLISWRDETSEHWPEQETNLRRNISTQVSQIGLCHSDADLDHLSPERPQDCPISATEPDLYLVSLSGESDDVTDNEVLKLTLGTSASLTDSAPWKSRNELMKTSTDSLPVLEQNLLQSDEPVLLSVAVAADITARL